MENGSKDHTEVLEFEHGVRAYPPRQPGAYWRLRWEEQRRSKETTARSRAEAIAKATEIVERLASGVGTEVANASGADLVGHFLDPRRRPSRVKEWSDRMREEQERYCSKYVHGPCSTMLPPTRATPPSRPATAHQRRRHRTLSLCP